jgi:multimeric flavodoxin WrbA
MKKVVVINGSPSLQRNNTGMILKPFLEGMQEAGASISLFYTSKMKINPCNCGIMYCWNNTPGKCIHTDEMDTLLQALKEAEICVIATPVYTPIPGELANTINRLCPLLDPNLSFIDGRTRARLRSDVHLNKFVLVGVSGWWELENLETVVRIVKELAATSRIEYAGGILRPHAYAMKSKSGISDEGKKIIGYVKQAGYELISQGVLRKELLSAISQPLIPNTASYNVK